MAWFLEAVWRLDPEEVEDAICDGPSDKGIDALVVDDDLAEITILQGKWITDPSKKAVGDLSLKQLVGAADLFKSGTTVQGLIDSKPNQELKRLLVRLELKRIVEEGGHVVRLVFVTNGQLDASAQDYLKARKSLEPPIDIWDRARMAAVADRTQRPALRPETVTLRAADRPSLVDLTPEHKIAIAIIPARELVRLPGLDDFTLFSRNVRLLIKRSTINENLKETIDDPSEHALFPAFHNGLTILTGNLSTRGRSLTLRGLGVVNGCQSLATLYERRSSITQDLNLLVKVVEVQSDNRVSDLITYRSNNQNTVTLRDQRSNDHVMRDLQRSVRYAYGTSFDLRIRTGEITTAHNVLDNAFAAQLVMAVYLREPWAAVRKVRLFDDDYRRIFNRRLSAQKLYLLNVLNGAVESARADLRAELRSSFASVRFTLAHLVAQVCRLSGPGRLMLEEPELWLPERESEIAGALEAIASEIVDSVNFYIGYELTEAKELRKRDSDEDVDDFDPKTVFKSQRGVINLERDVIRSAKRSGASERESYLFDVTPPSRRRVGKRRKVVSRRPVVKAATKRTPSRRSSAKRKAAR